jgi:hypothetical protein
MSYAEATIMFAEGYLFFESAPVATSVAVAVGGTVASLVYVTLRRFGARGRRFGAYSAEEDLPWEDLLPLLQARERDLAASGLKPEQELPPDELLASLIARLPARSGRLDYEPPREERHFLEHGGADKRSGRRRWGNPTSVYLTSALLSGRLHGVVINRSTGGLGIFVDQKMQLGTLLEVRGVEAPRYVPSAEIEVKFCRKVRGHYIIGCQFVHEIPWNVRVWFG